MQEYWAPSNVATLNAEQLDVGASAPIPVNNGTALFIGGDDGSYYLLNASALGGANALPLGFIPADPTLATGAGGLYK